MLLIKGMTFQCLLKRINPPFSKYIYLYIWVPEWCAIWITIIKSDLYKPLVEIRQKKLKHLRKKMHGNYKYFMLLATLTLDAQTSLFLLGWLKLNLALMLDQLGLA